MIRLNVENLRFFGTVSSPPIVRIVNDRIGNMRGEPAGCSACAETATISTRPGT